jgi:FkbM family methyltransferase
MQFVHNWYLPDDDTYFAALLKEGGYQQKHRDFSLGFVKNFRNAVDVGAHVGFWTKDLAARFDHVYAFEPLQSHISCFQENIKNTNCTLFFSALSNKTGYVNIRLPGITSANAKVSEKGDKDTIAVSTVTLDSYSNFSDIDYIKIDVEGYELRVLQGAKQTILKNKPVITIEQKKGAADYNIGRFDAVDFLKDLGMKVGGRVVDDFVMVWD